MSSTKRSNIQRERSTILRSPFELRHCASAVVSTPPIPISPLRSTSEPPLTFTDIQPESPRLLEPILFDTKFLPSTNDSSRPQSQIKGSTHKSTIGSPESNHWKPPGSGEKSVPRIVRQNHLHRDDSGKLLRKTQSMTHNKLQKDSTVGIYIDQRPGTEEPFSVSNSVPHHEKVLRSVGKQMLEMEKLNSLGKTILKDAPMFIYESDDFSRTTSDTNNSSYTRSTAQDGIDENKEKFKIEPCKRFDRQSPSEKAPGRTERIHEGNYIGPEATKAFFDLCAETQRTRAMRSPCSFVQRQAKSGYSSGTDTPAETIRCPLESAFTASTEESADMTPRQMFVNSLSETIFKGTESDTPVVGLIPAPIILRSGRPKLHLKGHRRKGDKGENDFNISHHKLGDDYGMLLSHTIDALPKLSNLNLRDNRLTDRGMAPIISAVTNNKGCRQITTLNLSENKLDSEAIHELAAFLQEHHCAIKRLELAKADIDDGEARIFAEALGYNTTVTHLNLSNNLIGGTAERLVASKMGISSSSVSNREYDQMLLVQEDKDRRPSCAGIALGSAIRINGTLRVLDLSWNQLGRISGIEIGHALGVNNSLRELIVANNSLGDAGAQLFGDALRTNNTLRELDMSNNDIRNRGACVLAGALHTNRTLHKFLLNNNPLGKYGGRAMLGTWNFMEMEREIRMSGCSFDLLDPDSTSFDPSKPGGKYCLKVGDPLRGAYDKYVAHELCRMATVRNGHFFEHIEHISKKGHLKEIHLKRIDAKKRQKISKTKTAGTFKVGASKWLKAKEKTIISKGSSYWSDLDATQSKEAVADFALVDEITGEKWIPPSTGILNITFRVEPALPSMIESINMTGLNGLVDLMMSSPGERLLFLEDASIDIRFTCPQVHQLIVKLNSTHIPFTGDEICRVFACLLPRVLDTENLHRLIETHLSFKQHQELLSLLGPLYIALAGTVCGHYELDLRKNPNDRSLLERLVGLSAAERRYNLSIRPEVDAEDHLHGPRGTNERGKWGAFRNVKWNGSLKTEEAVQQKLRRRLMRDSIESDSNAHIIFDYAPAVRAPQTATPLQKDEFAVFLKRCAIFDISSVRRTLNLLNRMPDISRSERGRDKKKKSSDNKSILSFLSIPASDNFSVISDTEADLVTQKHENCYLRDIYLMEMGHRDLEGAVRLPLKGRTGSGRSFDDDAPSLSSKEGGYEVLRSEQGNRAQQLSKSNALLSYFIKTSDSDHTMAEEASPMSVLSGKDLDAVSKLVREQTIAFVEGFDSRKGTGIVLTRIEVFVRVRILIRVNEAHGRQFTKALVFKVPSEAIPLADDPFAIMESTQETKAVAKEIESKAERKMKKILNKKKKTLKLMQKGLLETIWKRLKAALFGTDLRSLFKRRDRDGGGLLDLPEFIKLVRLDMRLPASQIDDADLENLVVLLDDDGGMELGVDELLDFAERGPKVFAHLMDEDNLVTMAKTSRKQKRKWAKELNPVMIEKLQHGMKAACYGSDIETIFKKRDKDRGGTLDFAEFNKLIRTDLKIPTSDVDDVDLEKVMVLLDDDSSGELGVKEIKDLMERGMDAFSDVISTLNGGGSGVGDITPIPAKDEQNSPHIAAPRSAMTPKKMGEQEAFFFKDTSTSKLDAASPEFPEALETSLISDKIEGSDPTKVVRQQPYIGARLPVDFETGVTLSAVTKSALALAEVYLSKMSVTDMGGHQPVRNVIEVCKLEYDRAPCSPHTIDGMNTHVAVHYCDVLLESKKPIIFKEFCTVDEHSDKEWELIPLMLADPIPSTISAMVDPKAPWSPVRQMSEIQFRLGDVWITTDQAIIMIKQFEAYYEWNLVENLAVSLFGRVVDVENWKNVLLQMESLYNDNHPKSEGFLHGAVTNTLSASKSEPKPANPPGFKGIAVLEERIGWLNMLNPCEVEEIRFDLDMYQYEDHYVGRVLARLAFKEEGDNFQQPCYRKHSSTWIDGWNITTDWDEIDYDEALENRRKGPPPEGQLVVTYKVDIVERDEEERERLKNCSFLCGMPRPPKGISAMESDHHLHNRYLDDSA